MTSHLRAPGDDGDVAVATLARLPDLDGVKADLAGGHGLDERRSRNLRALQDVNELEIIREEVGESFRVRREQRCEESSIR